MEVMNTAGRARAIEVRANRDVRHKSPAEVKGRPYFVDGTHQSASQHISSRPNKTFETSKCGSHKTNPRPIMSMAALLKALFLAVGADDLLNIELLEGVEESVEEPSKDDDAFLLLVVKTRYINALAVNLVQFTPNASSTPFEFDPPLPIDEFFSASRSNNAPMTPKSITAVDWFLLSLRTPS